MLTQVSKSIGSGNNIPQLTLFSSEALDEREISWAEMHVENYHTRFRYPDRVHKYIGQALISRPGGYRSEKVRPNFPYDAI